MNLYKYASPTMFYPVAGKMIPWFAIPAAILFAVGMYVGFFVAPTDFQQGDAYRIIFIHVPAAWMGMFLYVLMAIYAGIGWAFNARLSSMMASAIAITGAMFTLLSLVTGALWGKPTWGTYWVWDARMTSTLISAVSLYRLHFSPGGDRRPAARGPRRRGARAGRRDQCAHHLLFSAVVEYTSPGRNNSLTR